MKKVSALFFSILILTGCASVSGDYEYKQVDATVNHSELIHKVCIPERNLHKQEYYYEDVHKANFFPVVEYNEWNERYLCKYGVYEVDIRFNNPMTNRMERGKIIAGERFFRDQTITIQHRYRN